MNSILRWGALFVLIGGVVQAAAPAAAPILQISPSGPTAFDINAPFGGPNPTPSTLTITNAGNGNMDWTASDDATWLSLSNTSGKLSTGTSIGVSVQVDVTGLAVNTYTATITVGAAGLASQTATVKLHISAVPLFGVSPGSFTFAAPQGGANPAAQTLTVQNTGGGTLSFGATVSQSWLKVDGSNTTSGSLGPAASQDIQVTVLTGSLGAGTHNGTITLSSAGATNSPQVINVTFTVNANPAIGLQPSSLTFDAPEGGPNPATKQFTVKNDGGGTLSWTATDNVTWLTLNPTGGSLVSGASQVVTVTVDVLSPTPLTEQTYPATVTVTATGLVTNSPQTLGVTLNVSAIPKIGLNDEDLSFTMPTDTASSGPTPVSLTNTGSGTLNWTVTGGASWVLVSPVGGSLTSLQSQPLQVTAIPFGKPPGVYTTTLQIEASGASNSPRTISVEMTVTPSSLPTTAPAGQCGLLGLELIAVLLLLRSLKSRGGPSCTSR
jgi:hypothetical protein